MLKIAQRQGIDVELPLQVGARRLFHGDGAVMPPCPCCRQFCTAFLWELVCWQCNGRNQKESGHSKKKKPHLLREGKAREGNTLGSMALEMGGHKKMQLAGTHKQSALERVRQDWSGWGKKGTWRWGGLGLVRTKINKKVSEGHSLAHVKLPRTRKKGGAVCNWSVHRESKQVRHSPMECLGRFGTGNGGGNGSCEGETQAVRTLGERKQVTHLPA